MRHPEADYVNYCWRFPTTPLLPIAMLLHPVLESRENYILLYTVEIAPSWILRPSFTDHLKSSQPIGYLPHAGTPSTTRSSKTPRYTRCMRLFHKMRWCPSWIVFSGFIHIHISLECWVLFCSEFFTSVPFLYFILGFHSLLSQIPRLCVF